MGEIIRIAMYLMTALLPLIFTTVNYELFEFPKFLVLLAGTGIITIAWVIDAVLTRRFTFFRYSPIKTFVWLQWSVLAVLATQIVATVFSIHPYTSFWGYYSRFHQGLLTTICYTILFFAAINWLDTKSVRKLINISIKTSIVVSLIAILEHFNISVTCMLMTFLTHLKSSASPLIANASCWGVATNPHDRSFATIGQPNWLAAYLIPNFFLGLYADRKHSTFMTRYLYPLVYSAAIVFTKSRSGLLALAVSYGVYWLVSLRTTPIRERARSLISISAILAIVIALFGTPVTPSLLSLTTKSPSTPPTNTPSGTSLETGGTESGDIRKIVWSGAFSLISHHLLLGTGPETFAYTYYWERPVAHNYTSEWDFLYNKAHNEYLNMAATTGLIGLGAYLIWHLAMGALSFSEIPQTKKTNKATEDNLKALLPVMAASMVAFGVTNFFGFSVVPVYFLIVLISALPLSATHAPSSDHVIPPAVYGYAASAIIIFVYFVPFRLFLADYNYTIGKANNAIPYLEKAVALRPEEDLFRSALAESYAAQSDVADYRDRALQEAVFTKSHNPYHLNYYKSRVKVYLALAASDPAFYAQAASELVRARQLAPTDPKLAYNLGLIYSRLGSIDQAEREINQAIELKKDYQEAYYALTLLYEQTKQTGKIPELLRTAQSNLATYSALLKGKMDEYLH